MFVYCKTKDTENEHDINILNGNGNDNSNKNRLYEWYYIDLKYIVNNIVNNNDSKMNSSIDFVQLNSNYDKINDSVYSLVSCTSVYNNYGGILLHHKTRMIKDSDIFGIKTKHFLNNNNNNDNEKNVKKSNLKKLEIKLNRENTPYNYNESIELKKKEEMTEYFRGYCLNNTVIFISKKDIIQNCIYYLNINYPLPWSMQRLLWIAFYKNDQNKKCILKCLPKVLVQQIIALCQHSVFD